MNTLCFLLGAGALDFPHNKHNRARLTVEPDHAMQPMPTVVGVKPPITYDDSATLLSADRTLLVLATMTPAQGAGFDCVQS